MRKFALALVLASVAAVAGAQPYSGPSRTRPLVSDYDIATTGYTYCLTTGNPNGATSLQASPDFWADGLTLAAKATTSGSSTTVTSATTGDNIFAPVGAGDELLFPLDGVYSPRYVSAKASSDSITVNSAINLSGGRVGAYVPIWRKLVCGTAATSGWFPVRGMTLAITIGISTLNSTSISADVECRHEGSVSPAIQVFANTYTATGGDIVSLAPFGGVRYTSCRVGLKEAGRTSANAVTVQVGN